MQQLLLAALLVSRGELVTVDSLILELWGGNPPSKVQNALQAQVSRIRRSLALLEPERPGSRVITTPSGYLFSVGRQELDAHVFMDTVDRVRRTVADGASTDPGQDVRELRRALAFWSGPVFGGLRVGPLCQAVAARYVEAKNAALTLLFELELKSGSHARILPELAEAYEQNPTNEKLCMLLMGALYRCGRQRDALGVYRKSPAQPGRRPGGRTDTRAAPLREGHPHPRPRAARRTRGALRPDGDVSPAASRRKSRDART